MATGSRTRRAFHEVTEDLGEETAWPVVTPRPRNTDRYLHPREGWLPFVLALVMVLALALAVEHAGWRLNTDLLVPLAVGATVAGTLLALSRAAILLGFPLSAVLGAALVLIGVGSEYHPGIPVTDALVAVRADVIGWLSAVVHGQSSSSTVAYAIAFGVAMWVTAFVAGYALYRRSRSTDVMLVVGVPLLASACISPVDLLWYGVPFGAAALLLRVRLTTVARASTWHTRRILAGDRVGLAVVRTGALLTVAIVLFSVTMASVAIGHPLSARLSSVVDSVQSAVGDLAPWLPRVEGGSGGSGTQFGSTMVVGGTWDPGDAQVLTATEEGGNHAYYLAAVAYDKYLGHGWSQSAKSSRTIGSSQPLFVAVAPGRPTDPTAYHTVQVQVLPAGDGSLNQIVVPVSAAGGGFPVSVSVGALASGLTASLFGRLDPSEALASGAGFTVTSVISTPTRVQLAAAGTVYPQAITDHYLGELDALSQQTIEQAHRIASRAAQDPYDEAIAIRNYLRGLAYDTAPGRPGRGQDLVDYLLFESKGGYCEYLATAMAMMARAIHIPARVVVGYLPGDAVATGGFEYGEANRHAWAELYFPGYGWQVFEATPNVSVATRSRGSAGPTGNPESSSEAPSLSGRSNDPGGPTSSPRDSLTPSPGDGLPGPLVFALLAALLISGALVILIARRRARLSSGPASAAVPGDRQWRQLLRVARRAGVSPLRTETDYEYAAWLEDQIPTRAPEIRTMADARVWSRYSGRPLGTGASHILEAAWRRLRGPLRRQAVRHFVRRLLEHR